MLFKTVLAAIEDIYDCDIGISTDMKLVFWKLKGGFLKMGVVNYRAPVTQIW
jgi:hypothetical protein